jgi:hypothetical protein
MDKLSKTVDIVRAAAGQIHLEDRLSSTEAMFRVSEEIAHDRGMSSPVKQRLDLSHQLLAARSPVSPRQEEPHTQARVSKAASTKGSSSVGLEPTVSMHEPVITRGAVSALDVVESHAVEQMLDSAADELLQHANIKPIPIEERETRRLSEQQRLIEEDAYTLSAEISKKDRARNAARLAMSKSKKSNGDSVNSMSATNKQNLHDHYFGEENTQPLSSNSLHENSRTSLSTKTTVKSSISDLGNALNNHGGSCKSYTEALFRNMKVLRQAICYHHCYFLIVFSGRLFR